MSLEPIEFMNSFQNLYPEIELDLLARIRQGIYQGLKKEVLSKQSKEHTKIKKWSYLTQTFLSQLMGILKTIILINYLMQIIKQLNIWILIRTQMILKKRRFNSLNSRKNWLWWRENREQPRVVDRLLRTKLNVNYVKVLKQSFIQIMIND